MSYSRVPFVIIIVRFETTKSVGIDRFYFVPIKTFRQISPEKNEKPYRDDDITRRCIHFDTAVTFRARLGIARLRTLVFYLKRQHVAHTITISCDITRRRTVSRSRSADIQ